MLVNNITWPLYHIRTYREVWREGGILYLLTDWNRYIVDNTNLSGDTLGKRRIQLKTTFLEDDKIYPLKDIFYSLGDILKHKHQSKLYIDSKGKLINWKKKHRRDLLYRKVINIEVHSNTLLCYCENIFKPIVVPYIPVIMPKYLGLVKIHGDYQLYELSCESKKDTWRKI